MKLRMLLIILLPGLALAACARALPAQTGSAVQPDGWSFQVIQDGRVLLPEGDTYRLVKRPFLLQLTFPLEGALQINVLDKPTNYGLEPSGYCQGETYVFCPAYQLAEGGTPYSPDYLAIHTEITHYLSADTPERWATFATVDGTVIAARSVDSLVYVHIGEPPQATPIKEFEGDTLYFVLYMDLNADDMIDPGEIGKFILLFTGQ
mgnify:CR=1 FL=1